MTWIKTAKKRHECRVPGPVRMIGKPPGSQWECPKCGWVWVVNMGAGRKYMGYLKANRDR